MIHDSHAAPSATLERYLQDFGCDVTQIHNPESVEPISDSDDG